MMGGGWQSGGSGRAEDATPGVNGTGTTCQRNNSTLTGRCQSGGCLLSPASKTTMRRLMLLLLLLLLGAAQTVTATDARAAETRGPSMTVGLVLASFEALLFAFAVVVLSLTLVMFVRLYDALSPPTKTMLWITAANVVLAALYLLFAGIKLFYLGQGLSVPQGQVLCRYLHPVARTCQLTMWLGQPICAWVTLKTIRNQPLPPGRVRALTAASTAIAAVFFVLSEIYMPGKIVSGSFCAVPPPFAKQHSMYLEHFSVPFPLMDPRTLHALVMVISLFVSLGYYIRAHRHLAAFKKRWRRNVQAARRKHLEVERIKNSHLRLAIEGGSDDAGSISVGGGGRRRSLSPFPLLSEGAAIQQQGNWYEEQEEEGLEKNGRDLKTSSSEREGSTGGGSLQAEQDWERRSCDGDEDWRRYCDERASMYSDLSRDSDDPVSLAEVQKRTLAAQQAAVLVLIPPYPPTPPHQHQHPRQHAGDPKAAAAAAMEGGLGGRTGPDASRVDPDASAEAAAGGGGWMREESDREKAEELLHKASRTLVNRSLMLLAVFYLPFILVLVVVANYRDGPPPLPVALVVFTLYNMNSPVLQSFVLVHLAVTVGHNILRLEQSASTTAKAGKGPDVEEQEREAEEEQPGISPRRRRGRPGSSDADDDKKEGAAVLDNGGSSSLSVPVGAYAYERGAVSSTSGSAKWASDSARGAGTSKGAVAGLVSLLSSSPTKEQRGRPVHASPRRRPRASGPSSHRSLAAVEGATAASDSPSRPLRALTTIYEVAFRARGPTIAGSSPAAGEEEEWGAEREDEEDAHTRGGGTSALESTTAAVVQETLGVSLAPPSVSPAASAAAFSSSGGLGGKQMRRAAAGAGAGGDGGVAPSHGGARGPSPTAALLYRLPRAIRSLFSPVHGGGGDAGAGPYAGFQSEVSSLTDDQSYRSSVSWAPRSLLGRRLPPPLPSSGGKGVLPDHVVAPVDAHGAATPVAVAGKEAADEGAGSEGGAEDREVAPLSLSLGPQGGAAGAAAGKQSVAAVSVSTEGSVSSGGRSIVTESEWRAWREDKSV